MEPEIKFLEAEFQRVTVGPKDAIVVSCDCCLSVHAMKSIYGQISSVFPGHEILVLEEGFKLYAMGESGRMTDVQEYVKEKEAEEEARSED